ncbi:hypothetical protein PCC7424_1110 [Gloeothece citriformis PCC 7424]|uniref:Uncharacterized protein n=1 Tax=Gloeothece citriformis (strain PCC 7424) TaxID=65393 RepID=B7KJW2_GLOC7|nr:hypothetical protein [Gloeothece citriformis]ACK69561.1 hypothetical protein PCC7424_1110 [Gloeothece citriformis PCC 7424]
MLMRHFAYFNNVLLFIDIRRNQLQSVLEILSTINVSEEEFEEIGEDLGELLGRVIEAKIDLENMIIPFLKNQTTVFDASGTHPTI